MYYNHHEHILWKTWLRIVLQCILQAGDPYGARQESNKQKAEEQEKGGRARKRIMNNIDEPCIEFVYKSLYESFILEYL